MPNRHSFLSQIFWLLLILIEYDIKLLIITYFMNVYAMEHSVNFT